MSGPALAGENSLSNAPPLSNLDPRRRGGDCNWRSGATGDLRRFRLPDFHGTDDSLGTVDFLFPHLLPKLSGCFEVQLQARFLKNHAIDLPRRFQGNNRVRHVFLHQRRISFQRITVAAAACYPHIKHIAFVKLKVTVGKNPFLAAQRCDICVGGLLLASNSLTLVFSFKTIMLGAPG